MTETDFTSIYDAVGPERARVLELRWLNGGLWYGDDGLGVFHGARETLDEVPTAIDRPQVLSDVDRLLAAAAIDQVTRDRLHGLPDKDLAKVVPGITRMLPLAGIGQPVRPDTPPDDERDPDRMQVRRDNNDWLDGFIREQGVDTGEAFEHTTPSGRKFLVPLDEIVRVYRNVPLAEQAKIRHHLETLAAAPDTADTSDNPDQLTPVDYLGRLGGAVAPQYEYGAQNPDPQPENRSAVRRFDVTGSRVGRITDSGGCPMCQQPYGLGDTCRNCTDAQGRPYRPDTVTREQWSNPPWQHRRDPDVAGGIAAMHRKNLTTGQVPAQQRTSPVGLYVNSDGEMIRVPQGRGSTASAARRSAGTDLAGLRPATRDEIAAHGRESGRCMICGRALTGDSMAEGIGPKCKARLGA